MLKKTYNESLFKSIVLDVRSILPKKDAKKSKKFFNMLKN